MRSTARVVVIGGGIAGCSTLYHLTAEGWSDVMLLERDELTSGTTWHSAAQVTHFGANQVMVALKAHSIALYRELAADPEHPVGYHYGDGGIRLAGTEAQMDGYRHFASLARAMGVEFEVIDAAECARRHPLLSTEGLLGGLWDPHDGDIDPAQLCAALAGRARRAGAEVHRQTPVTALDRRRDGTWIVTTPRGTIEAEHVVNAAGYRCNEVAALMGCVLPVASMEHQYFVTEDIPAIRDAGHRMPLVRCPISDFYSRQERSGLLVGFYEQDCRTWGLDGIDPGFTSALCPDDLGRVMDVFEGAVARMPVLAEAGIKRIVNGPITYTIDGTPLVGPVPGQPGAWCITGLRAGLGEGGGHGWLLAQQIVHGEAEIDTWPLDPRRFTGHATVALTAEKAVEDYRNEFRFHFPHEHRPAGRPMKTTPLTDVLAAEGAEFATVNGWERADYFRPTPEFTERHGFRLTEAHDVVAAEVAAVHERVGLAEVNGFTRIEVSGADAEAFLRRVICGRLPREGRVGLAYLLNAQGCLKSEATLARVGQGWWYGAAAAAEWHDRDWLAAQVRPGEDVRLRPLTDGWTTLLLAGPRARAVLAGAARGDWSAEAFPWLSLRRAEVGRAPAVVMAVSYSGEPALEVHLPTPSLLAGYEALREAGAGEGMALVGGRAIEAMRIEKSYLHWKAEIITEVDPFEAGLGRFVRPGGGYLGAEALAARQAEGPRRQLVTLALECADREAQPGAALSVGGAVVGSVTSGAWGHRTGLNLALAYVSPEHAAEGSRLRADLAGKDVPATVIAPSPFDPEGTRQRR